MWKTIIIPVGLTIAFWAISAMVTTQHLHWLEQSETQSLRQELGSMRAAGQMRYTLRRLDRETLAATRPYPRHTREEMAGLEAAFLRQLEDARATAVTSEEADLVELIGQRFNAYIRTVHADAAEDPGSSTTQPVTLARLADGVAEPARRLGDLNERLLRDASLHRASVSARLVILRNTLLLVGPAIGLLCGFWISRRLHRSISRISVTLRDVAAEIPEEIGRIRVHEGGDLPRLRQEVDRVVARIRDVFAGYTDATRRALTGARLAAAGEMAAEVAHEIRNPLTSVKLLIQMAGTRPEHGLTQKECQVMLEEICRMERTVQQLLDLARPSVNRAAVHELGEIVMLSLNSVAGRARQAEVRIDFAPPSAPLLVQGDADRLLQVFGNLLQNAIEASGGQAAALVRVHAEVRPGGMARVSVEDCGGGISPAVRKRLFEPFVTDKPRGTGLGLAISRRIVEEHGGTLTAANCEDAQGAVFAVELPLTAQPAAAPDAPAGTERAEDPVHAQVADH